MEGFGASLLHAILACDWVHERPAQTGQASQEDCGFDPAFVFGRLHADWTCSAHPRKHQSNHANKLGPLHRGIAL